MEIKMLRESDKEPFAGFGIGWDTSNKTL